MLIYWSRCLYEPKNALASASFAHRGFFRGSRDLYQILELVHTCTLCYWHPTNKLWIPFNENLFFHKSWQRDKGHHIFKGWHWYSGMTEQCTIKYGFWKWWPLIFARPSGAFMLSLVLYTGLHQKRVYTSLGTSFLCIGSRFNKNAYMHLQTIEFWCTHCGQEKPKLVYTLFWCKPVCRWRHLCVKWNIR